MKLHRSTFTIPLAVLFAALLHGMLPLQCTPLRAEEAAPTTKITLASDIQWEQLNPARGDASPKAATLWGDRKGKVATGFLVKFVDGFSSPPHIHNVSYRGVVIGGGVHNDDPEAEPMWMPAGSYWTQPAGEVHITSSRGAGIAYIEIGSGPYLVLPTEQANDNGERPVNVTPSNLVWLDASTTSWIQPAANANGTKQAELAFLWGAPHADQRSGSLLRLPAGFSGSLSGRDGKSLQAVVIQSNVQLAKPGQSEPPTLTPGSYFTSEDATSHRLRCEPDSGCQIYIRSEGDFTVAPN